MMNHIGLKSSRGLRAATAGLALASLLAWSASARATLIVNDTWQDSNRTEQENGTDSDSDTDIESAWFINSSTVAVTPGHLNIQPPATSSNWTTYFAADATPVTLANAGDSMFVKLKFTPSGVVATNTSQAFPFAIVDTPNSARLAADGAPGSATYAGYAMYTNMAATLGNSNPFQLRERTNPGTSSTLLNSSGDWTALGNGATTGSHGYDSGTQYTMTWTMTRTAGPDTIGGNADDGLSIDVLMTGGTLNGGSSHVAFTDTTPNTFSFDTFNVRPAGSGSSATSFDLNQFQVDFTKAVPEPASLLLLGLGGVGMLLLGRRGK